MNIHQAWFSSSLVSNFEHKICYLTETGCWQLPNASTVEAAFSSSGKDMGRAIRNRPLSPAALLTSWRMSSYVKDASRSLTEKVNSDLRADPSRAKNRMRFSLYCWSIYVSIFEQSFLFPELSKHERAKWSYADDFTSDLSAIRKIDDAFYGRTNDLVLLNLHNTELSSSEVEENKALITQLRDRFKAHQSSRHMTRRT